MQIEQPQWQLTSPCPVCGQGSTLTLVACPSCRHVAVICAEEGTGFASPFAISTETALNAEVACCPQCAAGTLSGFVAARSDDLVKVGLTPEDYR